MKFVVFKGTAGWGDRLQCLLQIIKYAKTTGRYLVLDWRDEHWSDDGRISFDDFFNFSDEVKHFSLQAFLELFRLKGDSMTVFPKAWKAKMLNTNIRDFVYKDLFCTAEHGKAFNEIADYVIEDFDSDIVVYSGTGFRGFTYSDFSCIKPNDWLQKEIGLLTSEFGLTRAGYDVVHLRAGSKKWAGGKVNLKSMLEKLEQRYPDLDAYISDIHSKYQAAKKEAADDLPLKVLSDSAWLAEEWIKRTGKGVFLGHNLDSKLAGSGIHELNSEELQSLHLKKFDVDLATLRDFAVMLNSRTIFFDDISLFSRMAEKCKSSADEGWLLRG